MVTTGIALSLFSSQSQMDVDSGIETMEVDEADVKYEIKRKRVSCEKCHFNA